MVRVIVVSESGVGPESRKIGSSDGTRDQGLP